MNKQVIEETQELCTLCGGRGQEASTLYTSGVATCRQCQGNRYIVTKRVIRTGDVAGEIQRAIALGIRDGIAVVREGR